MIVQGLTHSFKRELLEGIHNFASHTFKIALFTSAVDLNADTETYSTTNEVVGTGYVAGGATLTAVAPVVAGGIAYVDFADASWPASSITARGALIYNSSASDKAVAVLNFGSDRVSDASTFTIIFPNASPSEAIIRIR